MHAIVQSFVMATHSAVFRQNNLKKIVLSFSKYSENVADRKRDLQNVQLAQT